MEPYKVGDTVMLKSGGPNMTVDGVEKGQIGYEVSCRWFVGSDLKSATFSDATLIKISVGNRPAAGGSRSVLPKMS